jgi:hypothetical protein
MTKTATITPGLKRLRASPKAESIRAAVLDDQRNGRAEALAKIEAEKAADAEAIDLPAAFVLGAPQTPTDGPHAAPAPGMPGRRQEGQPARPASPASRAPRLRRRPSAASSPPRQTSPRRATSDSAPSSPP